MTGPARREVVVDDRYYILASSVAADLPKLVLKHDDAFLVADTRGDFPDIRSSEFGFYVAGTRFLRRLELRIHGQRPLLLNASGADSGIQLAVDLANPDLRLDGDTLLLGRTIRLSRRLLLDGSHLCQQMTIESFAQQTYELELSWEFDSDFVDVFEVRGFTRARRGTALATEAAGATVRLGYQGLDGIVRTTILTFNPPPLQLDAHGARYVVALKPGTQAELGVDIAALDATRTSAPIGYAEALSRRRRESGDRMGQSARIRTSDELFNRWIAGSWRDMRMLMTATPEGDMPYAGIPWYVAPFGRDSLTTALQLLPFDASIARGTLRFLAHRQARRDDNRTDQEPGKILHEYREGELANCGEIVFTPYYGSVDATPLFVILLGEYWRWTGDEPLIQELWPALVAAIGWMTSSRSVDAMGYLTYMRRSPDGLLQQGWKDSHDAVMHADGEPARPPIALIEVQGYKYAALQRGALLADAFGHPDTARVLREHAAQLQERVERDFWMDDQRFYALALDGEGAPCAVITSNPGHCLWAGLVTPDRARLVARHLMRDDMFSGWGLRTLATGEHHYNPMSYHNGSVWPHDTALVAAGFHRYLLHDEFLTLCTGLYDAVAHYGELRMPELFCGFPRVLGQGPTRYPAACSPQAWAAGAVFHLVSGMLGLEPDASRNRLTSRQPMLPPWLEWMEVRGLRLRGSVIDLHLSRGRQGASVEVLDRRGTAEIVVRR
jgi:glycogen debranching enzyme